VLDEAGYIHGIPGAFAGIHKAISEDDRCQPGY
jgi:hypothetical protein